MRPDDETDAWHRQDRDDVLRQLGTDPDRGLSTQQAATRLAASGPNRIAGDNPPGLLALLARQLTDVMIALLAAAALISGLLGDVVDAVAILVIVVLNAATGVIQEFRAQHAVAALKEMSAPLARVLRNGTTIQLPSLEIVPGDIVRLEAGDVVPADMRLIDAGDLGIDESALTGESVPVAKSARTIETAECPLPDRLNMAYRSTLVTRGRGRGVVVATGARTRIGNIAAMLRDGGPRRTPLQQRLEAFSRRIALLVVGICALVFAIGLLDGQPVLLMFMTALSLAVAAVPEALPAVVTVSLGIGARRLSRRNALVRRLPAVESLGSVGYICADKTGTLTENRMRLGVLFAGSRRYDSLAAVPESLRFRLGQVMALCHDSVAATGRFSRDPTEIALIEAARSAGYDPDQLAATLPRIADRPFESERQSMVTLHRIDGAAIAFSKGAPERLVPACSTQLGVGGREPIDPGALATAAALAGEGFRVLALAVRELDREPAAAPEPDGDGDWMLVGLAGLIDPPRAEVRDAIARCRSAGITPVMITGDHPATAQAVAAAIGISTGPDDALTGTELAALSDSALSARVEHVAVYSRVDPEQKIRIVNALQDRGHFVAMTGDGVNDAPALRNATIGVAMGRRGTEVAREASEIVLLDDSFATIVDAVHEGRRIFDDIRKFVRYTMTSNSGEIWVLLLAPFLGLPIPLLPLHILWINLVTDGFPGLALSAEPAERNAMARPPRKPGEGIFSRRIVIHILWVGLGIGSLTLAVQAWAWGRGIEHWQTMVFTVLVLAQLFHCLGIRSDHDSLLRIGPFSNPALVIAIAGTVIAQLLIIYVPELNAIFHTAPLSMAELGICFGAGFAVLVMVEVEKWTLRRRAQDRPTIR